MLTKINKTEIIKNYAQVNGAKIKPTYHNSLTTDKIQFTGYAQSANFKIFESLFTEILNIDHVNLTDCKNIKDIETIKDALLELKQLGCDKPPRSMIFVPFTKKRFTNALISRGISNIPKENPKNHYAYSALGHIFFNSLKSPNNHIVKHEMGHYLALLRYNSPEYQKVPELLRKNQVLLFNKFFNEIKSEVQTTKNEPREIIPEIFAKITSGEKFSDRTILLYDIAAGPRVPNLKINGESYENYINNLYKNWIDILGVKIQPSA